jgi:hypothetical protein
MVLFSLYFRYSSDRLGKIARGSYLGDQIKETEMGRAHATCAGEEKCIQGFNWVTWRKETTLKT